MFYKILYKFHSLIDSVLFVMNNSPNSNFLLKNLKKPSKTFFELNIKDI